MLRHSRRSHSTISEVVAAILAVVLTVALIGLVLVLCFFPLPGGAHDALMFLVGSLTTGWLMVLSYYFGSSADALANKARQDGEAHQ